MSVYVTIEDRAGESLSEVFELSELPKHLPQQGNCLPFVRETADTMFNWLQAPHLLAELDKLGATNLPIAASKELDRLVKLCRKYTGQNEILIRFYGETGRVE